MLWSKVVAEVVVGPVELVGPYSSRYARVSDNLAMRRVGRGRQRPLPPAGRVGSENWCREVKAERRMFVHVWQRQ